MQHMNYSPVHTGMPEESCARLIRAAVRIGVFKLRGTGAMGTVENNRLSRVMCENHSLGLKPMVFPKLPYQLLRLYQPCKC